MVMLFECNVYYNMRGDYTCQNGFNPEARGLHVTYTIVSFSISYVLVNSMESPVIVLDNGAATIKVGIVDRHGSFQGPRIIPNAVVRSKGDKLTYFGHEFARCKDYSSLHYRLPFEKVCRATATCKTYLQRDRDTLWTGMRRRLYGMASSPRRFLG
jgi:hypothetical protein